MQFQIIVADPPWSFDDKLTMSDVKRGAASQYPVLDLAAIEGLDLLAVGATNSLLALWCPSSMLDDGFNVMCGWGYVLKTTYIWVKTATTGLAFGMGRYFRAAHEIALIGTRGSCMPENKSQRSVIQHPALPHSAKPEALQDSLDLMYPGATKLELFARRDRPGWVCVGNECPSTQGEDIRASIERLASAARSRRATLLA
jgi:N6-adenosine-specific RNA methylase IME4